MLVDICVMIINLTFVFWLQKGCCYGNQLILTATSEHRLIPPSFFMLEFPSGLNYRHLNVCINSGDDVAILYKNLVNFNSVTLEIMRFIFVPMYLYWVQIGLFFICHNGIMKRAGRLEC